MFNKEITHYDGSLIHQRFAYRYFGKQVHHLGNIMAFRGSMEVTDNLVDLEDALKNDYIYSEDAIQFVWELPNVCRFGAVCFQRLFAAKVAQLLWEEGVPGVSIEGDDIMVNNEFVSDHHSLVLPKGKASVSICHEVNGASLGHLAVNISAGAKAPAFAYSTRDVLGDTDKLMKFTNNVINEFYGMIDDIFVATSKTAIL